MKWFVSTAGEALIDMVSEPDGRYLPCLGGAVYNLTRALARQGIPTVYQNPLSSDLMGRRLANGLHLEGVHLAQPVSVTQPTSLAMVTVDARRQPDYTFYREAVADREVSAQAMNAACEAWPHIAVVCTGGLALDPRDADKYLPWLQTQRKAGRWVVVDANLRPSVMPDLTSYRAHVKRALALADLIKVSDEDLEVLQAPGHDAIDKALVLMADLPSDMLALTRGAEGAVLLYRRFGQIECLQGRESGPVTLVDTVGAGDSFLAGLLACLLQMAEVSGLSPAEQASRLDTQALEQLLAHAVATATLNVMRAGCEPPTQAELSERLALHPVSTRPVLAGQRLSG